MIVQTISHYRISAKLDDSRAYVTYAATDIREEHLGRKVVLKVLPSSLVGTEKARERLIEAVRAAVTLNHPNICRCFEPETVDSQVLVVREFVEGECLADRVDRGHIEFEEAVSIFGQMARALDAVHRRGIVHRNLKASNVFLATGEGGGVTVKIADIGIVHLLDPSAQSLAAVCSPKLTYSSPEHALRTVTDHRSDIWSLGVICYEMLTGKPPFQSANAAAELLAILKDDYEPIGILYPHFPKALDWILGRCLAKNPNHRYETAQELASEIALLAEGKAVGARKPAEIAPKPQLAAEQQPPEPPKFFSREPRTFPWVAAVLGAIAAGLIAVFLTFPRESPQPRLRKYALAPPEFNIREGRAVISPDGGSIAYIAGRDETNLWVQDLTQNQPRKLADTNGATRPFWSPDGQWLGFLADGVIKKAAVRQASVENAVIDVCPADGPGESFAASWSADGTAILFTSGLPPELFRVPADGGQPKSVLKSFPSGAQPGFIHCLPSGTRRGSILLASARAADSAHVLDLRTGDPIRLGFPAAVAVYSSTGHILFQRDAAPGPLLAVPFSLSSMQATGDEFAVQPHAAWPSVSGDGTLVYRDEGGPWVTQLVWRGHDGKRLGSIGKEWDGVRQVILSQGGRAISVVAREKKGGSNEYWTYDAMTSVWRRESAENEIRAGVPSAAGDPILLSYTRAGAAGIYVHDANAAGNSRSGRALRADEAGCDVTDWSMYGRHIICHKPQADGSADLWRLSFDSERRGFRKSAIAESAFDERDGAISPDSRWVAYLSNRTGRHEVYVARFPGGSDATQVSREGGSQPRWGADSGKLYYVQGSNIVAVTLQTQPEVTATEQRTLFSDPGFAADPFSSERRYDVVPGEERFLIATTALAERAAPPTIRVVENWIEEFRGEQ